jgi:glycosyltransferase involved in cell wall biosynthesis
VVADALLAVVRDEDARRLAGAAARAHAERAFSWTTAVDRHEALYRALVAARAPLSPRSSAGA